MIAAARLAAYEVLRAVGTGRKDLATALAEARSPLSDERDRALAGEMATGTLRWQGAFDHLIQTYARRPLVRLDPEILEILRLGCFQLLHLDRVPASAAVNDAVNLAKKVGKGSAAPLVNALLRRVSGNRAALPFPPRTPSDRHAGLDYLETTLSHPRWLAARWLDRHGFESAEAWCRFNNEPATLTLRANRLRATRDEVALQLAEHGVETRPTRFAPDGLAVERGNPLLTPLAGTGLFAVQDESSQLVSVVAGAAPGERVLDLCAAPGGKTLAMAADMKGSGLIVSSDLRARRIRLLADAVARSGATTVRIVRADAALDLPFSATFDRILIDAPCSGLGTVRRDPDIKWRRTELELVALAGTQQRILAAAAAVLRPGGSLIYSTCSSEPEENEQVVTAMLAALPGFACEPLSLGAAPQLIDRAGHFRTLPFRDGLEAFFAAQLVRRRNLG